MRLQKFMARCGVASRRKSEELILKGKVKVNGKVVTKLGTTVDPERDVVMYKGEIIKKEAEKVYVLLNKPAGYVTTLQDEKGRRIVTDLIKGVKERIFPVGRLDKDTTGLLLLTNDGELTYKLTHPSNEIVKKYVAKVYGIPDRSKLERFRNGIYIDGSLTAKASIRIIDKSQNESRLEVGIHEGRNRQVRKMCQAIGHPVKELKRISIGQLELGNLALGSWRYLSESEINYLKSL